MFNPFRSLKRLQLILRQFLQRRIINFQHKSDSTAHKNLIRYAIDEINSSELEKVVLARTSTLEFQNSNEVELFLSIATSYPEAYVYCWFHPKTGFWLVLRSL